MNKTTDTMERKMKDSGIPWIGIIPEDWMVAQFKRFHKGTNVGESIDKMYWTENTNDIPFYTAGLNPIYTNFKYFPAEKYTKSEDLLMARNGTPYVYLPIINAAYTDHVIRVSLKNKINKVYAFYALSLAIRSEIVETVSLPTWSASIWNNQILPIPPLSEQEAIASWLDEKCGEIDELIEVEQKMIIELEAYRQAIITETVTRGINPDAPMRQTGITWIPEIPEHWRYKPMRYVIKNYKSGPFGSSLITGNLLREGHILVYTPEHIAKQTTIGTDNLFLQEERRKEMSQFFVETGDIIFPIVGSLGRAMAIDKNMPEGIINQRLAKFKIDIEQVNIRYFLYVFAKSDFYKEFISLFCRGSIIVNLTKNLICQMIFPLPSLSEQVKISDYLDTKCKEIDELIAVKREKIDTLKQYRQSIIFEAVTGKLQISCE